MKRLLAHALAIAIGACAGIAAAQLNGGVMESQRQGSVAITSGAINGTTIGATTPSSGAFTTLTASGNAAFSGVANTVGNTSSDSSTTLLVKGTAKGLRFGTSASAGVIDAVDNTGSGSYQPAQYGGSTVDLTISGTSKLAINSSGNITMPGTLGVTGVITPTGGVKGTTTNDAATALNVGELLTTTVASGSAVSLTTATSANIATLSLTAGDWDCSAQVTHNAAATTSVTLLQIGISATTATLPTQAGGSGIGTDPLAIWRQAAAVPGGALTTNVGPVRVTLAGTTNVFLVANDTFTVSTMTGYGTIRCRRMR